MLSYIRRLFGYGNRDDEKEQTVIADENCFKIDDYVKIKSEDEDFTESNIEDTNIREEDSKEDTNIKEEDSKKESKVDDNVTTNPPLTLRKFDFNKLHTDSVVLIVGRRHQGKSFLLRDAMYRLGNIPYGKMFTHKEWFYRDFFPTLFIDDILTEKKLETVVETQMRKVRKEGKSSVNNMLLVFDQVDYMANQMKKWNSYKKIFVEGRHCNMCIFITAQSLPMLRSNVDYVFLLSGEETPSLKKLYEQYGGVVPSFKMFKQIYEQCTDNFNCMVIDRNSHSTVISDKIFYYKAANPPSFKFGGKQFWDTHTKLIAQRERSVLNESSSTEGIFTSIVRDTD